MRISEIAKILNLKPKELVDFLNSNGFNVTHSNKATDDQMKLIREHYNYAGELEVGVKEKESSKKATTTKKSLGKMRVVKKHRDVEEKIESQPQVSVEPPSTEKIKVSKKEEEADKKIEKPKVKIEEKSIEEKVIQSQPEKIEHKHKEAIKEKEVEKKEKDEFEKKIESVELLEELKPSEVLEEKEKSSIRQVVFDKHKKELVKQPHIPFVKPIADKDKEKEKEKDHKFRDKEKDKEKPVSEEKDITEIEKKKFVKKNLQELTHAIESTQKRATKKKNKLLKLLKKKKIAEKLANQMEQEEAFEKTIRITDPTTVQELAQKMHKSPTEILKFLISQGVMVTINQKIDADIAEMVALEFGYKIEVEKLYDDVVEAEKKDAEIDENNKVPRAPVVTVMGHVDHGKTSLLDAIRKTKVVDTESGGITQHIGAYKIEYKGQSIVFLDTPGHYAFSSMRSRGASITDIVVLIVAADDGLMPQTIEAINHARAAKVPIIVAINKIDKPGVNIDRVKQQLSERNLLVESWGGEILDCEISALKNQGIDNLLELILLQTEMLELKCNPDALATGTVIEAAMERGQGPTMTVLVQNGTLKIGDSFVCGVYAGKVRSMFDENNNRLETAGPSTPVKILGCDGVPEAGDPFNVTADEKTAREISEKRMIIKKEAEDKKIKKMSFENLFSQIEQKEKLTLNLILKCDVRGSVEAIHSSLNELGGEKINVNIIHEDVGGILESDIMLAAASNAIVIGFKVRPEAAALSLAKAKNIEIRLYDIIYKLIDDMKAAMSGMLGTVVEDTVVGTALVKEVFKISGIGKIAGCVVNQGKIVFPSYAKLIRDNIVLYDSKLNSLKHYKNDVKEVNFGQECGIGLDKYEDIKVGDIIECYVKVEKKQEL